METLIGFDSAWTNNVRAPGAICALQMDAGRLVRFHAPKLVSFEQGLTFINEVRAAPGVTLVALDQPTIVPNLTSMRPVERVAASVVNWAGGGVQPANRGRKGMFCDDSPIWSFLSELGAIENPEQARVAADGLYLMEVFPALALPSFDSSFCGPRMGPRYNPGRRKTFKAADWERVAKVAAREASVFGCEVLAEWCRDASCITSPKKAEQDQLDSVLCLLIALRWRLGPREGSMLLGDLASGYMVLPISADVRARLSVAARKCSVPMDGNCPI